MKTLAVFFAWLLSAGASAGPATKLCSGEIHTYAIEVTTPDSSSASFEAAVGGNGELRLLEAKTPYRIELSAGRIIAMFASSVKGAKLRVTLYGMEGNESETLGFIEDESPLVLENAACPENARAFGRY